MPAPRRPRRRRACAEWSGGDSCEASSLISRSGIPKKLPNAPPELRKLAREACIKLGWVPKAPYGGDGTRYHARPALHLQLDGRKGSMSVLRLTPEVLAPHVGLILRTFQAGDEFGDSHDNDPHVRHLTSLTREFLWIVPGGAAVPIGKPTAAGSAVGTMSLAQRALAARLAAEARSLYLARLTERCSSLAVHDALSSLPADVVGLVTAGEGRTSSSSPLSLLPTLSNQVM